MAARPMHQSHWARNSTSSPRSSSSSIPFDQQQNSMPTYSGPPPLAHYNSGRQLSDAPYVPPQHPHQQPEQSNQTAPQRGKSSSGSIFSTEPPTGEPQRLYNRKRDKELYEDMSAVFSILTATERLENMWARRGAISQYDYEAQCEKLLQQYNVLRLSTEASIPNLDLFIAEYDCKANMARPRLKAGVPATVDVPTAASGKPKNLGKFVLRCTTLFHQLATYIDLGHREVNMLLPDLSTLTKTLERLARMTSRSNDFEFSFKLNRWTEKLNTMPAHAQLTVEDAMQLKLDLDTSFQEFERVFTD